MSELPLVGRDAERHRLEEMIEAARDGRSGVLCIVGEPGTGKTALVDWLVGTTPDFEVLRATAAETEANLAFAGLSQLIGDRTRLLDHIPVVQADALRSALAIGPAAGGDRFAIGAGLLSVLGAISDDGPVLLVADDTQWLDQATTEALAFACRRLDAEGIVVVLSGRAIVPSPFERLPTFALEGLDLVHAEALVGSVADCRLDGGVIARIHRETLGNPLAIVEIAQALSPVQLAGREPLPDPLPVGDRLEGAFRERMDRLPAATRWALLLLAADAGRCRTTLGRALARDGLRLSALEPAERASLVSLRAGDIAFRHPVVRAACYHGAADAERRAAHRLLAEVEEDVDLAAWQAAAASVGPDEGVAARLAESADRAKRRGAPMEAARAYAHAASLTSRTSAVVDRLLAAANAYELAGELERAVAVLDDAEGRCTNPRMMARIQHLRATIELWKGRPLRLRDLLLERASRLVDTNPEEAAMLYLDAILPCVVAGEAAAAVGPARKAANLVGDGHPLVELTLGIAATEDHLERSARPHLLRAGAALVDTDPTEFRVVAPLAALALGVHREFQLAHMVVDRLIAAANAQNMPSVLPFSLAVSSILHCWSDSWAEAGAAGSEAVSLAEATGQAHAPSLVFPMFVEASRGREEVCRDLAERAAVAIERTGGHGLRCWRHAALGRLELTLGRADAAVLELEWALAARPPGGMPEWTADLVEAYDIAGRSVEGDTLLERLRAWAERNDDTFGRALVARAAMGRTTGIELDEVYGQGAALLAATGGPFSTARHRLTYGERLRREKRLTEARGQLRAALDTFVHLDAGPWRDRALRELRACGGAPRVPAPDKVATLTPQELRVASVIAEGTTNREAATRLVVSPKTIAFHLGNVYRKLGIRSRVELVRILAEAQEDHSLPRASAGLSIERVAAADSGA